MFGRQTNSKETTRIEAFSDGVFAIAITLLVLDIHVPEVKGTESLLSALVQQWTNYLAFLVGFFTILVCWINHHCMFEFIHKTDSGLVLTNGFKLLIVSFTPFVTAVLSRYINTPQQPVAVTIYALNFLFMGFALFLICWYAYRKGYIEAASPGISKAVMQLYAFAAILSATIFLVSFFSTYIALLLFFVMFLIFIAPKKVITLIARERRSHHAAVREVLQEAD